MHAICVDVQNYICVDVFLSLHMYITIPWHKNNMEPGDVSYDPEL